MNGTPGKIEILKPLDEAFELMKKILFRPFDLKKWFVIGFAAFLAGHFAGIGFNFPFGGFPSRGANQNVVSQDWGQWEEWKPWLPILIAVAVVLFLAVGVELLLIAAELNSN